MALFAIHCMDFFCILLFFHPFSYHFLLKLLDGPVAVVAATAIAAAVIVVAAVIVAAAVCCCSYFF